MRRVVLLMAAVGSALLMSPTSPGGGDPDPGRMQVTPAKPPTIRTRGSCQGKVLAVTGGSIEVRSFGNIGVGGAVASKTDRQGRTDIGNPVTVYDIDLNTGMAKEMMSGVTLRWTREQLAVTTALGQVTTIRRADRPPRRFPASAALAAGGYGGLGEAYAYRLSDVRVGDEVDLELRQVDGVWECTGICIRRRPGGRVPPSRVVTQFPALAWHERMNAEQDWEEKGIPLPAKFDPAKAIPKLPKESTYLTPSRSRSKSRRASGPAALLARGGRVALLPAPRCPVAPPSAML